MAAFSPSCLSRVSREEVGLVCQGRWIVGAVGFGSQRINELVEARIHLVRDKLQGLNKSRHSRHII